MQSVRSSTLFAKVISFNSRDGIAGKGSYARAFNMPWSRVLNVGETAFDQCKLTGKSRSKMRASEKFQLSLEKGGNPRFEEIPPYVEIPRFEEWIHFD